MYLHTCFQTLYNLSIILLYWRFLWSLRKGTFVLSFELSEEKLVPSPTKSVGVWVKCCGVRCCISYSPHSITQENARFTWDSRTRELLDSLPTLRFHDCVDRPADDHHPVQSNQQDQSLPMQMIHGSVCAPVTYSKLPLEAENKYFPDDDNNDNRNNSHNNKAKKEKWRS